MHQQKTLSYQTSIEGDEVAVCMPRDVPTTFSIRDVDASLFHGIILLESLFRIVVADPFWTHLL